MRDTANVLLACDMRQAEVVELFSILSQNKNDYSLLVKLVKGAVEMEIENTGDIEGLFLIATPNVYILMNFFAMVARPYYENLLYPLLNQMVDPGSATEGFPQKLAYIFLNRIVNSADAAPNEIIEVCKHIYDIASRKFQITKVQALAPFIIYRGFASILSKPQAYGLMTAGQITPNIKYALLEIAKSLISLATVTILPLRDYDEILRESNQFLDTTNINAMDKFLSQLVDKPIPNIQPSKKPSEKTVDLFLKLLNRLLVRVNANGINKNERLRNLLTELHATVSTTKEVDVDIHSNIAYKSEIQSPESMSRILSKLVIQPKSEEILELGNGKLIDSVAFKLVFKEVACLINIPKNKMNMKKLKSIIKKAFFAEDVTIKFLDDENDYIPVETTDDIKRCVEKSRGLTIKLYLTTELSALPMKNAISNIDEKSLANIESRLRTQYPGELFLRESFVISDPSLPDNPLIFVNDGFEKLTLYPSEEILGKNCRFLQGKSTNTAEVNKISRALKEGSDVNVELINYRRDGKPFWNRFHIYPLRDENNKVVHFVAVQQDITHMKQRAKNPMEWTPSDVAGWLDFMKISTATSSQFENFEISGRKLLLSENTKTDIIDKVGVKDEKERERIMQFVEYLKNTSVASRPTRIPVKIYYEGEVKIINVKPTITLKELNSKIQKALSVRNLPLVIQYENEAKEKLCFVSARELNQCLQISKLRGESFRVWVSLC